jgi:hypothetical protein
MKVVGYQMNVTPILAASARHEIPDKPRRRPHPSHALAANPHIRSDEREGETGTSLSASMFFLL